MINKGEYTMTTDAVKRTASELYRQGPDDVSAHLSCDAHVYAHTAIAVSAVGDYYVARLGHHQATLFLRDGAVSRLSLALAKALPASERKELVAELSTGLALEAAIHPLGRPALDRLTADVMAAPERKDLRPLPDPAAGLEEHPMDDTLLGTCAPEAETGVPEVGPSAGHPWHDVPIRRVGEYKASDATDPILQAIREDCRRTPPIPVVVNDDGNYVPVMDAAEPVGLDGEVQPDVDSSTTTPAQVSLGGVGQDDGLRRNVQGHRREALGNPQLCAVGKRIDRSVG